MRETDIVPKEVAYAGDLGRLRREFCARFLRRKQESFRRIQRDIFARIRANGQTVTCREGCSACCVLYVEADIQECEAIVHFLYDNPDILVSFVMRYNAWRDRMRRLGDPFAHCERVLHEHRGGRLARADQDVLLDALALYHEQDIPCPFLADRLCSIYEVRPYACVNHYVTTPDDWCRARNWCNPGFLDRPQIYMTELDEIYDRSFYHGSLSRPVIGFMPATVYRILTEGLEHVADLTGLAGLRPSLRPRPCPGEAAGSGRSRAATKVEGPQ